MTANQRRATALLRGIAQETRADAKTLRLIAQRCDALVMESALACLTRSLTEKEAEDLNPALDALERISCIPEREMGSTREALGAMRDIAREALGMKNNEGGAR